MTAPPYKIKLHHGGGCPVFARQRAIFGYQTWSGRLAKRENLNLNPYVHPMTDTDSAVRLGSLHTRKLRRQMNKSSIMRVLAQL